MMETVTLAGRSGTDHIIKITVTGHQKGQPVQRTAVYAAREFDAPDGRAFVLRRLYTRYRTSATDDPTHEVLIATAGNHKDLCDCPADMLNGYCKHNRALRALVQKSAI